jgi:hypothetical protein
MHRHISQFVVVLLLALSSFALLRVSTTLGSSNLGGDSPHATQTVRSYYAALNRFLAGGDIEEMSRYFAAEAPATEAPTVVGDDHLDQALAFAAFRSTFPNLKLELVETSTAGNLVIARTVATTGEASLPYWLNGGVGAAYQPGVESFRVENEQIVEHWSSARPTVMAQSLILPGVRFWLDRPARLMVSELVVTAFESQTNCVSVTGPGLVIPKTGALTVEGDGQLRIASWVDGTSALIPLGEEAIVSVGQILVIPRGQAVIRQSGDQRTTILLMSLVPSGPEPQARELDGSHERIETLGDVLREPSTAPANLWFGTARVLASAPVETDPGWLSLDLTEVIMPPGERLDIEAFDFQIAMVEQSSGAGSTERDSVEGDSFLNTTNSTRVFTIARACSLGSELARPVNCATTKPSA